MKKILKISSKIPTHDLSKMFKARVVKYYFTWDSGKEKCEDVEYQCPICKEWFDGHRHTASLRMHIARVAKIEAVGKMLGEISKIPHFEFWKKYTRSINVLSKPREWIYY